MSDEATEAGVNAGAAPDGPASYEQAHERLQSIIDRLDSGDVGLRETQALCAEARDLVEYCAAELDAVSKGLEELELDELVGRLERREGGAQPDDSAASGD